jgi:hypothetical protein
MAFAQAAIPLPQPRPGAANHWFGGIFQPSPSFTAEPEPVHRGDY